MAIETLLPKKLNKTDAAYKSAEELKEALSLAEKKHIRNIALTGPFGSGKSSVLVTLMDDFASGHKFLPISLATLQTNEEDILSSAKDVDGQDAGFDEERSDKQEKQMENLNRKIEYSILQQIIYREKTRKVPNSRFRRIVNLSKWELLGYPFACVLTVLCFLIVFEPSFARVDSIAEVFNWGRRWNTVFDFVASGWLLFVVFAIAHYVFKSYSNSKLNKLNLKDGEIEIVKDNSIFNRHLDEILYFFQVTDYDVVIIEDLDRFGTPNIFLKLRELNRLVNESKIVGRHITFIYAIRDDVFKDEERPKFFDYIVTVIPVIDSSNSKAKLKEALDSNGCGSDITSVEDLSEIAFFIQDMRILTNIVNEYRQYRDRLCASDGALLDKTKLLAMIVYKNYYPQDFALLQRREGKVYECFSSKHKFVIGALKNIEKLEEELSEKELIFKQDIVFSKDDLRRLFLFKLWHTLSNKPVSVNVKGRYCSFDEIASNESLFSKLLEDKEITYRYNSYYNYKNYNDTESKSIDFKQIDKEVNYSERIERLEKGVAYFERERRRIQLERNKVKSLKLKELFKQYKLGGNEEYRKLGLPPMLDVFLRRGYIDENYYDYMSYFYEGMVSHGDRELLLAMRTERGLPYDYHIDKIDNFVMELQGYMFESDAILNIDLLDYLASDSMHSEKFDHMMSRLECVNAPLQFLSQYYTDGKHQDKVFSHYIGYENSWDNIVAWDNVDERDILIDAYLKFCPKLGQMQQAWLNDNYKFLAEHCGDISLEKASELASGSHFVELCGASEDLLDYVIEYDCYDINLENLLLVAKQLHPEDKTLTAGNLNYTRIKATNNESLVSYVEENISTAIQCFKDENKDESPDALIYLLTNTNIDSDVKIAYLTGQHNHIDSFADIKKTEYDMAVGTKVILPTWENVSFYYTCKSGLCEELNGYVNHYATELSKETYPEILDNKDELYSSLFGSDALDLENYGKLLKSFSGNFPDINRLRHLDTDRLKILIDNGRVPFSQEILNVMNGSEDFVEYIVYHSEKFVKNLDLKYNFNEDNAYEILARGKFDLDDKYNIIGIIPVDVLQNSQPLADLSIEVFSQKQQVNVDDDVLEQLLKISNDEERKIQLVTSLVRNGVDSHDSIAQFLLTIGGAYAYICDKEEVSKLTNNPLNAQLLAELQKTGFISSFKEEKDELWVCHEM
ncbi:MAG: hypothetical protein NC115_07755 [Bacteroidales bacterium]|nr:hypothetical protein [Bacteroidales bacterium]